MLKACCRKVVGGLNLTQPQPHGAQLPRIDVGSMPASAPPRQRAGHTVGALQARNSQNKKSVLKRNAGRAMEHARVEDVLSDSTSIARCRELLGGEAEGLSDHEVDLIRQHAAAMAHVIVEVFLEKSATPE